MTLTYLTNQVVYLGSHFGDSQLLQINSSPTSNFNSPTLPVPASIPTIKPAELGIAAKSRADDNAEGTIVNGLGSHIVELENFSNLAPIVDGILVDTDNSGQVRMVLKVSKRLPMAPIERDRDMFWGAEHGFTQGCEEWCRLSGGVRCTWYS
jgi:hypothetical protein